MKVCGRSNTNLLLVVAVPDEPGRLACGSTTFRPQMMRMPSLAWASGAAHSCISSMETLSGAAM